MVASEQKIRVTQCQMGDQEAYEALIREHQRMIHSLCYRMTGSIADAEDLAQESSIHAYRHLASFRSEARFSSWLYRIAVNLCLNWQARQQREERLRKAWAQQVVEPSGDDSSRIQQVQAALLKRIAKSTLPFLTSLFCAFPLASHSQLQLLSTNETQQVFGGAACRVPLTWRNAGDNPLDLALRASLFQASSASVIPLGETAWKRLAVLPGQTLLESAIINLPPMKAETRFVIQWLAGSNIVVGTTQVLAYPTNLLLELKPLAGQEPLGVLYPNNALKPLLKAAGVEFSDLEDTGIENHQGKLVIAGPFQSRTQMHDGLAARLQELARKGVAVVWMQPPPDRESPCRERLKPSFYTVPEGKAAVVIVQAPLLDHLSEHPQAQLNLIQLARLALHPEPPRLPFLHP